MRFPENNFVAEALETAKKAYLTEAKKKENLSLIEEIMECLNDSICEHVINGFVTLKLEVNECKIHSYKILEGKQFSVDESCYKTDDE
jgi:hypothetical protein